LSYFGVVSPKYRHYFAEASDCVFKKMTLRKCTTSFDKKMKMKVSTKISLHNKPLGSFIFKNFEIISWILVVIMIISMLYSGYMGFMGVYNWVAYGNCNGPDSTQACILNNLTGRVTPNVSGAVIIDGNLNCDTNLLAGSAFGK